VVLGALIGCHPSHSSDNPPGEYYLYAGTNKNSIYEYKFDTKSGKLDSIWSIVGVKSPTFFAISRNKKNFYTVNQLDSAHASVSAFAIDKSNGHLTFLNKQSTHAGGPCYVDIDKQGRAIFTANWNGGSFSMIAVKGNGSLGKTVAVIQDHGHSVNPKRQYKPFGHCSIVSPDNKRVFFVDLGTDKVSEYAFDSGSLSLSKQPVSVYKTKPGAGPRHLTFTPDGHHAYLISEITGLVVAFNYKNKKLQPIQTLSNAPKGYTGDIHGGELHVSPDGKFLYISNRGDLNNIVVYLINQHNGKLTKIQTHASGGINPRYFLIDPTGKYVLVANSRSNNLVVFKRNKKTGKISPTGIKVNIPGSISLAMVPAK
jgi:6-phosphogluconolactonase